MLAQPNTGCNMQPGAATNVMLCAQRDDESSTSVHWCMAYLKASLLSPAGKGILELLIWNIEIEWLLKITLIPCQLVKEPTRIIMLYYTTATLPRTILVLLTTDTNIWLSYTMLRYINIWLSHTMVRYTNIWPSNIVLKMHQQKIIYL